MKIPSTLQIISAAAALFVGPSLFAQKVSPKFKTVLQPKYPAELVDTAPNGEAVVSVTVKADGSVVDPVLKSATHPAFGVEALAVLGKWTFEPGTVDGVAKDMPVEFPLRFRPSLEQAINAKSGRKVYTALPEGEKLLTELQFTGEVQMISMPPALYPKALEGSGIKQDVTVKFHIAPDGQVLNPQIQGEPNANLILPTIIAVSQGKFQPPMQDNKPVYVEMSLGIHFEETTPESIKAAEEAAKKKKEADAKAKAKNEGFFGPPDDGGGGGGGARKGGKSRE